MKIHLFMNGEYFKTTFAERVDLPKVIREKVFKEGKEFTTEFNVYSIEYAKGKNLIIGLCDDESIVIEDSKLIVKRK